MASLVRELQEDIVRRGKSVTEVLRTAKLISAKLGLSDISGWIDSELNGYKEYGQIPKYRRLHGGILQLLNPYRGWIPAGALDDLNIPIGQPVSELEQLAEAKQIVIHPPQHIPVSSFDGLGDGIINSFQQQIVLQRAGVKRIIEAVREKVLDWSIELEQRGIIGNEMSFASKEQESAKSQVFHIQQFTGVFGNVTNSNVQIYDYSSIHQSLRQQGVPQGERNELENIMDELQKAEPAKKKGWLEKAKAWVVRNQEVLGASAEIVRKALGLSE